MKLLIFLLFTIQIASAQQSCEEGFNTDPNTGRCVEVKINVNGTGETSGEIQDELLKKLEENNDPEEVKKLAIDKAKQASGTTKQTAPGFIARDVAPMIGSVGLGLASASLYSCVNSTSAMLMMGASGAVIAGEIYGLIKFTKDKNKLKKEMANIINQYKKDDNTLDQKKAFTSRLQAEAFEKLAAGEDAIAAAASKKHSAQLIAAGLYTAATVAAAFESIPTMQALSQCASAGPSPVAEIAATAYLGASSATVGLKAASITKDKAGAITGAVASTAAVYTGSKALALSTASALVNPTSRAVVAGTAAGFSYAMASIAKQQADKAKKRASNIREMKMAFVYGDDWSECEPGDRNSPDKPQCYCFNEDWSKNPARSESQVCNQHWGKAYAPEETDYSNYLAANGDSQSCVTKDYKDDPRCNCRSTNSCLSLPVSNLNLQSFPGISTVSRSNAEIANRYFQGKLEEGDLAKLENGNSAFTNKKILDVLASNPQTKEIPKAIKRNEINFKKAVDKQVASNQNSNSGTNSSPLSSPFSTEADKELKKSVLKNKTTIVKSNQRSLNKNSMSAPNLDLDFSSLGSSSSKSGSVEVLNEAATSETNYDSFESPVNADNGQSIFKVITHRYHQTGIKKLFAKRKRIEAE